MGGPSVRGLGVGPASHSKNMSYYKMINRMSENYELLLTLVNMVLNFRVA